MRPLTRPASDGSFRLPCSQLGWRALGNRSHAYRERRCERRTSQARALRHCLSPGLVQHQVWFRNVPEYTRQELPLPYTSLQPSLQRPDVLSLPALGPFGNLKLHTLAFLQAAESARLDRREMHENIFAALPADKAVAFGIVKPLYCSLFCHFGTCILFDYFYAGRESDEGQVLAGRARSCSQPIQIKRTHMLTD